MGWGLSRGEGKIVGAGLFSSWLCSVQGESILAAISCMYMDTFSTFMHLVRRADTA